MITRKSLLAIAAFDSGRAGWKKNEDGSIAVDADGNPIVINASGTEQSVKHDTVLTTNAEARTHRTAREAAEAKLKEYEIDGKLLDPAIAAKAVETMRNIDAKQLIDAGEVDKVRETIKSEYAAQISERDTAIAAANTKIENMLIDGVFKGNQFIADKVAMPADFFQAAMRNQFRVEGDKVVAYDKSGNRLMSKRTIGEYADPTEALELLVEAHPQKDTILRAEPAGGSGGGGGGGQRGSGRTLGRAAFAELAPAEQAEYSAAVRKGEATLVD
jgi:hypothetical protein